MKFFVVSDIHGFYDEFIKALDEEGFDKNNPDHCLISCGDNFDRGTQPIEVMRYLYSLPNKILIKGNHEQLLVDACGRGICLSHDVSNGTFLTIAEIGGMAGGRSEEECCQRTLARVGHFLDEMVPYFETQNYVFCHGWLPLWLEDNWRNANKKDWDSAAWENGIMCAMNGDTIEKTVVCGHYHTSWGHYLFGDAESEWGEGADFSPFYGHGIIAIDACTAYTGKVNVLVLEDELLEGPKVH